MISKQKRPGTPNNTSAEEGGEGAHDAPDRNDDPTLPTHPPVPDKNLQKVTPTPRPIATLTDKLSCPNEQARQTHLIANRVGATTPKGTPSNAPGKRPVPLEQKRGMRHTNTRSLYPIQHRRSTSLSRRIFWLAATTSGCVKNSGGR
ncbi:unnamed protein product, partial [Ectocarpus sp. 6 AP-2014]